MTSARCDAPQFGSDPSPDAQTPTRPWGSAVAVRSAPDPDGLDGPPAVVQILAKTPSQVASPSEAPDPGHVFVTVAVTLKVVAGSDHSVSADQFALFDPRGDACKNAKDSDVVPDAQLLQDSHPSAGSPPASGALVFEVDAGSDPRALVLAYNGAFSRVASARWQS
ncbi:hypothetical protein [Allobranchiibius sp. GilTou38]|uniref:hypothetical protein n=1 Tax=Allobranchiibius sp. GilTou38 TaxID=2815210 RepID=UPI001AA10565|nr:hypothetical protein [Allobranchiibius sp. GilTou38]MBO1766979.1 hypothetical protein [Allobranchiibius sp. GilTou38]